jgi:ribosome-associated toxin RatA of RatAB toxin-antitoxin module
MQKFSFQHIIHADAEKVFQNITDFSNYKYFLPGCLDSRLISKDANKMVGLLCFEIFSKRYSITSENTLSEDTITIEQVDGPFKAFNAKWIIAPIDSKLTKASLDVGLSAPLLLRAIVNETTVRLFSSKFISAFEEYLK